MEQIQLPESQTEFPSQNSPGRVRSRIHHSAVISRLKLMMMLDIVFASFWTVITCIIVIYPASINIELPTFIIIIFFGSVYVCFLLVLLGLKYGYLQLLRTVHVAIKVLACLFFLAIVIMYQYADFRKQICLLVVIFLYFYQAFIKKIIQQWPVIEKHRWRQYMDPITKFNQDSM